MDEIVFKKITTVRNEIAILNSEINTIKNEDGDEKLILD